MLTVVTEREEELRLPPKNSPIRRLKLMDAERQISRSGAKHPL